MNINVSVIVPVYNVENYPEDCIKSIEAQTYRNFEIILIDDGSTDSSGRICDKLKERYNNITVFHQQNSGVSTARNIGIDNAKGKYILFVDSDDYIDPEMLEKLTCAQDKYPDRLPVCGIKKYLKTEKRTALLTANLFLLLTKKIFLLFRTLRCLTVRLTNCLTSRF